ncbi:MAG: M56 family metallopeptidase [Acidobacteriia bacterium]|nr:M56 family metallopeptidase [Terriglobia bacterium]
MNTGNGHHWAKQAEQEAQHFLQHLVVTWQCDAPELSIDMEVRTSPAFAEPGVFGVRRPVLPLPAGITGHLMPPQLDAILTHELCHVHRQDNLAAAIHMAVEALFWFHPLVWWLGARLMEEREHACDEEVLRGCEPQVYAESILKICELYLASPLPCVSGVTGANLKKRIEAIIQPRCSQIELRSKGSLGSGRHGRLGGARRGGCPECACHPGSVAAGRGPIRACRRSEIRSGLHQALQGRGQRRRRTRQERRRWRWRRYQLVSRTIPLGMWKRV